MKLIVRKNEKKKNSLNSRKKVVKLAIFENEEKISGLMKNS